jgi:hypothetical protein
MLKLTDKQRSKAKERILSRTVKAPCVYPEMSECWIWQGSCMPKGYGHMSIQNKSNTAHRVSYAAHIGDIPDDMCACHKCDTPQCCNPDHLFLGTKAENIRDRDAKGRKATGDRCGARTKPEKFQRGENHFKSKLTVDDVLEIRRLGKEGLKPSQISKQYPVTDAAIFLILTGVNWKSVPEAV